MPSPPHAAEGHQPLRPLLQSLSLDLRVLLEQTAGLARTEIGAALRSILIYVSAAAVAFVIAIVGLLMVLTALVLIAVALGLPPWGAATLVGFLLMGLGAGVAYFCVVRLRHVGVDLPHTRHSVKETLAWLKAQATN